MMKWKGVGSGRGLLFGLSQQLPGGTEDNHENPVMIADFRAEIWTRDLAKTKQEC
jgi:hypothetical protein